MTWTRSPGLETEVALVRRLGFECFTLPLPKLDVRHPAKYFRGNPADLIFFQKQTSTVILEEWPGGEGVKFDMINW